MQVSSFAFDKAKLFAENFFKNSNLDDTGISLPAFPLELIWNRISQMWAWTCLNLMYLKESYFPDCWKVSSVVPVFKNVGERSTTKHPVSLLSVVSKVIQKLVNNRIVVHLEKCGLLSYFQVFSINCRSSYSCIW